MRVILLGAPGSGKGTVAELIRSAFGFPKISTGDLLREAVQKRTPLGLAAEAQMGKGGLVDDGLVLELLRERLSRTDCRGGYILDGYPRNLAQARSLESLDASRPEVVFDLETREAVIIGRLSSRRTCPSCEAIYNTISKKPKRENICDVCGSPLVQRLDDQPEVIAERMKTYHTKTEPLIAHYQSKSVLYRIDGNGTADQTFGPIRAVLDGLLHRSKDSQGRA